MKILKGKRKKIIAKLLYGKRNNDFQRDWLEGLQYIKDLPNVNHDI